jgi:hypothetical protein
MKFEFSWQIFEEYWISNFMKIISMGVELLNAEGRSDRKTGMTKLITPFRNLANSSKMPAGTQTIMDPYFQNDNWWHRILNL